MSGSINICSTNLVCFTGVSHLPYRVKLKFKYIWLRAIPYNLETRKGSKVGMSHSLSLALSNPLFSKENGTKR